MWAEIAVVLLVLLVFLYIGVYELSVETSETVKRWINHQQARGNARRRRLQRSSEDDDDSSDESEPHLRLELGLYDWEWLPRNAVVFAHSRNDHEDAVALDAMVRTRRPTDEHPTACWMFCPDHQCKACQSLVANAELKVVLQPAFTGGAEQLTALRASLPSSDGTERTLIVVQQRSTAASDLDGVYEGRVFRELLLGRTSTDASFLFLGSLETCPCPSYDHTIARELDVILCHASDEAAPEALCELLSHRRNVSSRLLNDAYDSATRSGSCCLAIDLMEGRIADLFKRHSISPPAPNASSAAPVVPVQNARNREIVGATGPCGCTGSTGPSGGFGCTGSTGPSGGS